MRECSGSALQQQHVSQTRPSSHVTNYLAALDFHRHRAAELRGKAIAAALRCEFSASTTVATFTMHTILSTLRQRAEEARGKAIAAALRREFNAPTTDDGGDSNPLTRRNKLSATNPLLGDDDDEF